MMHSGEPELKIFDDPDGVARAAAARIAELARESVAERGLFALALAGGSTPRRVYELLAGDEFRDVFDWRSVHVFFGDERAVPFDHADSNFRMANEALLSRVAVPARNVHRIEGLGDA